MVADFNTKYSAVPHGPESTGTKTKTTTTTTTTQQDEVADVSRFSVVSNKDVEEIKSVAVNKNTSSSRKQWRNVFNSWCSSRHLDINRRNPVSRAMSSVKSRAIHGNLLWMTTTK